MANNMRDYRIKVFFSMLIFLVAASFTPPIIAQDRGERTAEEIQQAERMQAAMEGERMAAEQRAQNPIQIFGAESESATYTDGDIPTDNPLSSDSSCFETLTVSIPVGATITGTDIVYSMTASIETGDGWMSEQRSFVRAVGGDQTPTQNGSGFSEGTFDYTITGSDIANSIAGGDIVFEMHAFRTWAGDGGGGNCSTIDNKVDNNTWTITVHYDPPGSVTNPTAFNATPVSDSQIDLTWGLNSEDDDILLAWNTEDTFGDPEGSYTPGASIDGGGTVLAVGDATTFDHTGLDDNTTYYYRIWSEHEGDYSGGVATSATTQLSPITSFPFVESFEESSETRDGWSQIQEVGSGSWTFQSGSSGGSISSAFDGDLNARFVSISGTNSPITKLVSPILDLSALTSARVSFYYGQEFWTPDQNELKVYYRESLSDPWVEIAHYTGNVSSWTQETLDLPNPTATYQIAFEGINNFGRANVLDLVTVEEPLALPPESASLTFPEDEITTFLDPELSWSAAPDGEPTTGYRVYFDTVDPPVTEVFDGAATSYQTEDLDHNTTYYWNVVAYNANGDADASATWSFTTVDEGNLAESFESTSFPPAGWANPGTWSRSTFQPFEGSASASKFVGSASDALNPHRLRTPVLTPVTGNTLEFAARTAAFNENIRLMIEYSDDGDVWTTLGTAIELPQQGPWEMYSFDLSSLDGDDYYLSFSVYSEGSSTGTVYLDYVTGPEVTALAPNAVTLTGPADEATDVSRTPDLSWTPDGDGGIPDGYRVYMDTNPAPTTEVADVSSSPYAVSSPLAFGETYYWKVVAYNSEGDAPDSDVFSFTTMDDPTITDFPYNERFPVLSPAGSDLVQHPSMTGWTSNGLWRQSFAGPRITGTGWALTTADAWLTTPPIAIPESSDYMLSFWYRTEGSTQTMNIEVTLSTDGETFDTEILSLEDYANLTYRQQTLDLSAYGGETIYIRFERLPGSVSNWGWALDDLFIGPAESALLVGQEGFFLISNPLEQNPVGNLLAPFWTQGFPGSDFPGAPNSNVYTFNESTGEYVSVPSANAMVGAGSALAMYVYDDDDYDGTPDGFPKDIVSVGPNWSGDIATSLTNDDSGWNLIGNPYPFVIDLSNAADGDHFENLTGFFYRYNNAESRWEVHDAAQPGVPDTFDGTIDRFEGFFVEANDADPEFTFKEDLEFMILGNGTDEAPAFVRLMGETEQHIGSSNVVFLEDHVQGRDGARFIYPLTQKMTVLYSVLDDEAYMMRYIDREFSGQVSVPVGYYTTDEGTMKLSWEFAEDMSEDWTFELMDHVTGEVVNLLEAESYGFEIGGLMAASPAGDKEDGEEFTIADRLTNPGVQATPEQRFELIITMTSTGLDDGDELPQVFALYQNYPNPFNPTTQINYDLPEAADVRLEVYNIMGQRVATLVNEHQNAGTHSLRFDAGRLASGVYIYRLQAGSHTFTRKMTLIK